jgi:hypothetical protein
VATVLIVVLLAAIYTLRRIFRLSQGRAADLGVVSTRWISELRRDEPWSRS